MWDGKKVLAMLLAIGLLALTGCTDGGVFDGGLFNDADSDVDNVTGGDGMVDARVVFAVTDAAVNMNSVSSVEVTIDDVSVYSPSRGWVDVMDDEVVVDLMGLRELGRQVLLSDTDVEAGTYSQISMEVSDVVITDRGGEEDAVLVNDEFVFDAQLVAREGQTSSVLFDFLLDESLYAARDGEYVFVPAVQLQTRSGAQVDAASGDNVIIGGGTIGTDARFGMNIAGDVVEGFRLPANAVLDVNAVGLVEIVSGGQGMAGVNASGNQSVIVINPGNIGGNRTNSN